MPDTLVVDTSSLIALERGRLVPPLSQLKWELVVPLAVKEELEQGRKSEILTITKVFHLTRRTSKKSNDFEMQGIGKGEAQCCALALRLGLNFIICDDQKFIRQRFFSRDKDLPQIKVLGFAFILHLLYQKGIISDVWLYFNDIIALCHWERSEVQVANYSLLKELGY